MSKRTTEDLLAEMRRTPFRSTSPVSVQVHGETATVSAFARVPWDGRVSPWIARLPSLRDFLGKGNKA